MKRTNPPDTASGPDGAVAQKIPQCGSTDTSCQKINPALEFHSRNIFQSFVEAHTPSAPVLGDVMREAEAKRERKQLRKDFQRLKSAIPKLYRRAMAIALTFLALCLTGCASFSSEQDQTKPDGTNTKSHQRIFTFWDANSSVAKLRASTTDKTQGLTVGGLDQESTSTNVNALVEGIVGAAVKAAIQGAK